MISCFSFSGRNEDISGTYNGERVENRANVLVCSVNNWRRRATFGGLDRLFAHQKAQRFVGVYANLFPIREIPVQIAQNLLEYVRVMLEFAIHFFCSQTLLLLLVILEYLGQRFGPRRMKSFDANTFLRHFPCTSSFHRCVIKGRLVNAGEESFHCNIVFVHLLLLLLLRLKHRKG